MSSRSLHGIAPGHFPQEELLFQSELSRVVRRLLPDGRSVVCKGYLGPKAEQRHAHEKGILERLEGVEGVPPLVDLKLPFPAVVMEDQGAVPWGERFGQRLPEGKLLLEMALRLARILAALHGRGVAHRNLCPANVLVDPDDRPLLVDFSVATTFAEERPGFVHPREIAGNLPYLAPEQTGRTGRSVDQRADLYGLGATLYQMATGRLPFEEKDPLKLIHDILAQLPANPSRLNPALPPVFCAIVMRLLEKEPERRYQSAQGVAHDLSRAAAQADVTRCDFPLGERDFPLRLLPPSRLVGRDAEMAALSEAYRRALAGEGSSLLVAGPPGVGKTALINQLRSTVAAGNGYFAAGKFDQYRRDLASDAVYQALRSLGRLLLAEPEEELEALRSRVLKALGNNAGLMTSLQPELALLIGAIPEPPGGDPYHCKQRLIQAAFDLLSALATPQRPLVMFLDDLQWGASTPLGLLDAVAMEPAVPGLLLVASFREEELPSSELAPLLSRWEQLAKAPPFLRLENLKLPELASFLQEMLRLGPQQGVKLARALLPRTAGNPYDTVELVNALRCDGTLAAGDGGWNWDDAEIRRYVGRGEVVELLGERIARLPLATQSILEVMGCLGGEVPSDLLAAATALAPEILQEGVAPALEDGLLLFREGEPLRFRHDRVQQACHARLGEGRRETLQLLLARRLGAEPQFAAPAAEQYLPVAGALREPAEKRLALSLFVKAAAAAQGVNGRSSERYLAAALELLHQVRREEDLPLIIELETKRHAALYSLGRLEEADRVYQVIELLAKSPLERAQAAALQVRSLTNRALAVQAVALGLSLLRELGIAVPTPEALEEATERSLEEFDRWIGSRELFCEWQCTGEGEPRTAAVGRLLNCLIPPAFFAEQELVAWWLVLESRRLWVERGPCAALVGPMSHLGFVSVSLGRGYRKAHQAVGHVLALSEARGWEPETSQARFIYALSVAPWFTPLQESVQQAFRAMDGLLQGGDLQNACFTYYASLSQFMDCAPTLEYHAAEVERGIALAVRTGNTQVEASLAAHRDLLFRLRGEGPRSDSCTSGACREMARIADQGGNPSVGTIFHVLGGIGGIICGNPQELRLHAAALLPLMPHLKALYDCSRAHLLQALAPLQQLREGSPEERLRLLAEFESARARLNERATDAPGNFRHLIDWLDAEKGWATGEFQAAIAGFDAALDAVQSRQFPWHRALITERAALFHLERGLGHLGRLLMLRARHCYDQWGAAAKVRQLEKEYPFLRTARSPLKEAADTHVNADAVGLLAVLRASQAISSETSLERLRTVVVELLGTMTGATAVTLVVWQEQDKRWFLLPAAPGGASSQMPVEEAARAGLLPISVFRYAERTMKPLLVQDATRDYRFSQDSYLSGCACCALLALPILNHGAPRAVLILENRLCRGAFTDELLDQVTLIAGQLAVSLENALLYEKLEDRVRERTRELQEAQSELMAAARLAGRAEIASNVLHNVGNVLNSVNVSAGLVMRKLRSSRLPGLSKSVQLIRDNAGDLGGFLSRDPRGKLLPEYLDRLARALADEQRTVLEELTRLGQSVEHIKDIVATQQCHAGSVRLIEEVQMRDLVEEALRINLDSLTRHEVTVVREFEELPLLPLDRARVLQILVNLIRNATQALLANAPGERRMTLRLALAGPLLHFSVTDQGEGIAPENLSRIFGHGFTTRKGGHGFGLHSCALAAQEMGGALTAQSAGRGTGATFLLELPVPVAEPASGK